MNDILRDFFSVFAGARNSRTGEVIEIKRKPGQYTYRFFQANSNNMYCYTVHPDTQGWYHSFVYRAQGEGARTGKARRWKLTRLVSHRTRKAAKARAIRLYQA